MKNITLKGRSRLVKNNEWNVNVERKTKKVVEVAFSCGDSLLLKLGWAKAWNDDFGGLWIRESLVLRENGSRFGWFKGGMKVVCRALREVMPTLDKRVLEGPLGMF